MNRAVPTVVRPAPTRPYLRQPGITLDVATFGILVGDSTGGGNELGPRFAAASHRGWWMVAAMGLVVAALGHLTTTPWAQETARRTAGRLEQPRSTT
jgi:hypothetical protein